MNALKAWAKEKEYMEPEKDGAGNIVGLIGFYGSKTGEDYATAGEKLTIGRKSGRKVRTASGQATVELGRVTEEAVLERERSLTMTGAGGESTPGSPTPVAVANRRRSLGDWLKRRRGQSVDEAS